MQRFVELDVYANESFTWLSNNNLRGHFLETLGSSMLQRQIAAAPFPPLATTFVPLSALCGHPNAEDVKRISDCLPSYSVFDLRDVGLGHCFAVLSPSDRIVGQYAGKPPSDACHGAIVVDAACGEAVLRGSSVFAPGVLASTHEYFRGEIVDILVWASDKPPLKGSLLREVSPNSVRVGRGVVEMDRKDITAKRRQSGVAVRLLWNPLSQPSLLDNPERFPCTVFLQNLPSMFPAAWLDVSASHKVLDCCAAPGGKSSNVILLARRSCGDQTAQMLENFKLVCCDRSHQRCARLRDLLVEHHGEEIVTRCVDICAVDVCTLSKSTSTSLESNGATSSRLIFDRVLLDPPCTGLGLRPRLRPHQHSMDDISGAADYQKHLFATAYACLKKPGGLLSYSTCTISVEENEGVVMWALQTFHNLRLRRVTSQEQRRAVNLFHNPLRSTDGRIFPWIDNEVLLIRFAPSSELSKTAHQRADGSWSWNAVRDTCGFFVAVFETS